jgi:hypothetical protein
MLFGNPESVNIDWFAMTSKSYSGISENMWDFTASIFGYYVISGARRET